MNSSKRYSVRARSMVCLFLVLAGTLNVVSDPSWPSWRGPEGNGRVPGPSLSPEINPEKQLLWKVNLPLKGNSTPVLSGGNIFLTQGSPADGRRELSCYRLDDGALQWTSGTVYPEDESTHRDNPFAAASPVTDGKRVIVTFGSAGVFCYDYDGNEIWRKDLGSQKHIWGYSSSPVIVDGLCIVYHGPGDGAFLVALDVETGEEKWRYQEPAIVPGPRTDGFRGQSEGVVGTFASPIVVDTGSRKEIVMAFPQRVQAFDPRTGERLWNCEGLNPLVYASPVYDGGIIVAMGGYSGDSLAVKPGGSGDVTSTHRLWHKVRTKSRLGSAVLKDGYAYVLNMDGIAECIELSSGDVAWTERLAAPGANKTSWSSMILSGDHIFVPNKSGDVIILKASPEFEQRDGFSLGDHTNASIAVSDQGNMVIRTDRFLWCLEGRTLRVSQVSQ